MEAEVKAFADILVASLSCAVLAGCRPAAPAPLPIFDRTQVQSYAETFTWRVQGDAVGVPMSIELHVSPESVVSSIIEIAHDTVWQHAVAIFDASSLRLKEVQDSGEAIERIHLTYSKQEIRGMRATWNPAGMLDTIAVDVSIDSATIDRRVLFIVAPWLPLRAGRVFTLRFFDSWTRRVVPVHIAIRKPARVTVPVGSFEAYRLDLTADHSLFPSVFYVSADSPRRLLRVDRPRQRAIMELTTFRAAP
jgi:hypothetical protein